MKRHSHTGILIAFLMGCMMFSGASECRAQETNYKAYSVYVYNFIK